MQAKSTPYSCNCLVETTERTSEEFGVAGWDSGPELPKGKKMYCMHHITFPKTTGRLSGKNNYMQSEAQSSNAMIIDATSSVLDGLFAMFEEIQNGIKVLRKGST